jgi:rhodanese-related sulfurtransferase
MSAASISPREVFARRQAGEKLDMIDVRTPAEYAAVHAEGARLVPLDRLDPAAVLAAQNGSKDQPLYLICKSGSRGTTACKKLRAAGRQNVFNIEGGTSAWEAAGLPVVRGKSKVISLERQVRIAAGIVILIGVALTLFVHRLFIIVPAFIGAGLSFAGITDFCGMALILGKMPWNRAPARCEA